MNCYPDEFSRCRPYLVGVVLLVIGTGLALSGLSQAAAAALSGDEILKRIDQNYTTTGSVSKSTMVIKGRRGQRRLTSKQWTRGSEDTFTHFLSPPREKDTKMLKLGDQLWIYNPSSDRLIKIAGHMLRQSVMGSDASYEDFMEDPQLSNSYDVVLAGSEEVGGRDCYVLALIAKPGLKLAYHSRKIWVDKERFLALQEELFAKSGKLLKKIAIHGVFRVGKRWYPKRFTFRDVLKKGAGTEIIIDSMEMDVAVPRHIFSKAALRK